MKFEIGAMRDWIRIEYKVTSQDPDYGTPVVTWTTLASVWADVQDVMPSKGAEANAGGMRVAGAGARIRIRFRTDVTGDMRVVLTDRGNRILKIVSEVAELGRKQALEFMGESFTANGDAA